MVGRCTWLLIGLLSIFPCTLQSQTNLETPAPERPRLVVLLVFDQMRGDYMTRWHELFVEDGFRRLLDHGAWFQNCNYPYSHTVTAPGHASLLTGSNPAVHGIVGNDWYDRKMRDAVDAVGGLRGYTLVGSATAEKGKTPSAGAENESISPERMLAPTVGDCLKEATGGKAKVVAVSLKDRSAVLLGGRRPDVCYWFDTTRGTFMTSSYYRDRVHAWVDECNRSRIADRWSGQAWNRLRPQLDYVKFSGPDDVQGESSGFAQGRVFPHPMGGKAKPSRQYYDALTNSPFGNDLLLAFAERAIGAENLGRHDGPDLLCISFSSNDLIGHCWGPDSQEVLDVTLRSDLIVKELLDCLDERVGKGRYLVVLTADHGVCSIPEVAQSRGQDAARIDPKGLKEKAEKYLDKAFGRPQGKDTWFDSTDDAWIFFDADTVKSSGRSFNELENALAEWLKKQPGVLNAYTRAQLKGKLPASDVIGQMVQRSYHPERCGDVAVVLKPGYLFADPLANGTMHGTPHHYDTHVPLLVYGLGVRSGIFQEPVAPQATAAIFAHWLGIKPPARAEYPLPRALAFGK